MIYQVYVVDGFERKLVATTIEPWVAYVIADRIERFPICDDVIVKRFDEKEKNDEVSMFCDS